MIVKNGTLNPIEPTFRTKYNLEFNMETRELKPIKLPEILSGDNNSYVIFIRTPVEYNGVDLTGTNCVIEYVTSWKQADGKENRGQVDLTKTCELIELLDEQYLLFTWVLDARQTLEPGSCTFSLGFIMNLEEDPYQNQARYSLVKEGNTIQLQKSNIWDNEKKYWSAMSKPLSLQINQGSETNKGKIAGDSNISTQNTKIIDIIYNANNQYEIKQDISELWEEIQLGRQIFLKDDFGEIYNLLWASESFLVFGSFWDTSAYNYYEVYYDGRVFFNHSDFDDVFVQYNSFANEDNAGVIKVRDINGFEVDKNGYLKTSQLTHEGIWEKSKEYVNRPLTVGYLNFSILAGLANNTETPTTEQITKIHQWLQIKQNFVPKIKGDSFNIKLYGTTMVDNSTEVTSYQVDNISLYRGLGIYGTIPRRQNNGNLFTNAPIETFDCTNKEYVDAGLLELKEYSHTRAPKISYDTYQMFPGMLVPVVDPAGISGRIYPNDDEYSYIILNTINTWGKDVSGASGTIPVRDERGNLWTGLPEDPADCINLEYFRNYINNEFNYVKAEPGVWHMQYIYATSTIDGEVTPWLLTTDFKATEFLEYGNIPVRQEGNCLRTPTPLTDEDCTNKKYVDDKIAEIIQNGGAGGEGSITIDQTFNPDSYFAQSGRAINLYYGPQLERINNKIVNLTPIVSNEYSGIIYGGFYQESEKTDTAVEYNFTEITSTDVKLQYASMLQNSNGEFTINNKGTYNRTAGGQNSSSFGTSLAMGKRSFACGSSNLAVEEKAFVCGCDNIVAGKQAFASGYANYIGATSSAVFGQQNLVQSPCSFIAGLLCKTTGMYSAVFGNSNIASYSNQFIIGKFNNNKNNTVFEVGYGADNDNRKNLFEVGYEWSAIGTSNEAFIRIGNTRLTESQLIELLK